MFIAIIFAWVFIYIYAETDFPGEDYVNGIGIFDAAIIIFNLLCFFISMLIVFFSIAKRQFSYKNSSFIILLLLFFRWIFSDYYHYIDLGAKSVFISINTNHCELTDSEYLNNYGIRFCYSWVHYPEAQFILLSNNFDLREAISSWPHSIVSEMQKEKSKYNFVVTCGYREIYKSFSNLYFMRVSCQ
ncbi:MAG: hypothetical protein CTY16_10350 [Methylobacter sp.]|nr:MAG: hypothetical protein CTY16_10350 [Methylobacter sp.]